MIEDSTTLTIKKNFKRPSKSQVNAFKNFQTGNVVDAMNGRGSLSGNIKPLNAKYSSFVGVALTSYCGPSDNLASIAAIGIAKKGDVVIAATDAFSGSAVMGDLMLGIAKNRGVKAFVTDGFVRDIKGINNLALPCFCSGVIPNSPARNGPGTVGVSVVCGGITINSGDIILGDQDGVVVVPLEIIDTVLEKLKFVVKLEKEMEKKVNNGLKSISIIEEIYKNGSIKEID